MKAQFTFTNKEFGIRTTKSSARENFEVNEPVYFLTPVNLPQNYKAKFEFMPNSMTGMITKIPGSTTSNPLVLNANTGLFSWVPRIIGLYSVCIKISEENGNDQDFIGLDFIIDVLKD
eukprot:TRINITY_DN1270_c1_g1_i1.p1 TRINITY_DN1270_c1_g1~~TRINITY_DN1270_c1_g1_i1.p1  ORF type:complete len:118 (-),score=11.35 TRINITY_DN1270_c1_g1_i1:10-363(-)